MAKDPVLNFAKGTVSTGYDASATSIVLASGHGAKFPQPSTDGAFNLVWWNSTDYGDPSDDPNVEIVRCTARATDTLTVTRAQESTSASTKNTGGKTYKMALAFTKATYDPLAQKGANSDITSLAGLTTPLSVAQGGTGVTAIPVFHVVRTTDQFPSSGVITKIQFNSESLDNNNNFDSTTNFRFTPTVAGSYLLQAAITYSEAFTTSLFYIYIYKNGASVAQNSRLGSTTAWANSLDIVFEVEANGSTDYFEVYVLQSTGVAKTLKWDSDKTWFSGFLIPK